MPRPRVLFVHGSVVNGDATWAAQRPLEERFELVIPNRRGFPPGPEVEAVDYEDEAAWLDEFLAPGTHLVGHSYGGVIALFAAARRPELLHSLTVVEPPALAVARGNAVADAFAARSTLLWESGPHDPETFLRGFLAAVNAPVPRGGFSPALLQGARTLMVERYPWTAEIPFDGPGRRPASRSSSSRAATASRSTPSATCSSSGSAPSGRCSPARAMRSSASASRSTTCLPTSSSAPSCTPEPDEISAQVSDT